MSRASGDDRALGLAPGGSGQAVTANPYELPAPPQVAPRLRGSYGAPVTPTGQFGFYVHANGTGAVISKGRGSPTFASSAVASSR